MTTDMDIDPRMVCRACGWRVDAAGCVWHGGGAPFWHLVDDLCDGAAYMSDVMQALRGHGVSVRYCTDSHLWRVFPWSSEPRFTRPMVAPTPHEAVFALATKIGRAMGVDV